MRTSTENTSNQASGQERPAEVICFGSITPAMVLTIEQFPIENTGALVDEYRDFISDDASVIACLLRDWEVRSGIIGTTLGADRRGQWVADQFKARGVLGEVRLDPQLKTPIEINISDATGNRTYFWQRKPEILATLDTADLSPVEGSKLLYVDWYDGIHILRPMEEATRLGIPIFLNLEHGHQHSDCLTNFAAQATICQVTTDAAQNGEEPPEEIALKVLDAGVEIVLVTLAAKGCLVADKTSMFRVYAPSIAPVDTCGAGSTFSAGFIYGYLQNWNLEQMARFATAAASYKCAQVGLELPKKEVIQKLANEIKISFFKSKVKNN